MSRAPQRLTYVEDDGDIRTIAELALVEIEGFTVDVCSSGPEAIDRTPAFKPDLIILDVMLPEMDGIEIYKRLREFPELKTTPVIFMTAKAMSHESANYRSLGAADVIVKPFDPLSLGQRIRQAWQQCQEAPAP
jgi:DNA-binding response OmpR family regulator